MLAVLLWVELAGRLELTELRVLHFSIPLAVLDI
jgi:hypothetical protein